MQNTRDARRRGKGLGGFVDCGASQARGPPHAWAHRVKTQGAHTQAAHTLPCVRVASSTFAL